MCSGQAWMELLSGLVGVHYLSGAGRYGYEILPDLDNALAVRLCLSSYLR
jgi:hypothetical protein